MAVIPWLWRVLGEKSYLLHIIFSIVPSLIANFGPCRIHMAVTKEAGFSQKKMNEAVASLPTFVVLFAACDFG